MFFILQNAASCTGWHRGILCNWWRKICKRCGRLFWASGLLPQQNPTSQHGNVLLLPTATVDARSIQIQWIRKSIHTILIFTASTHRALSLALFRSRSLINTLNLTKSQSREAKWWAEDSHYQDWETAQAYKKSSWSSSTVWSCDPRCHLDCKPDFMAPDLSGIPPGDDFENQ